MLLMAVTFVALVLIPVDFNYRVFAVLVFLNGLGGGIFTGAQHRGDHVERAGRPARRRVGCA